MSIIKFSGNPFYRTPWTEFETMRREMDLWRKAFMNEPPRHTAATVYPALNISEDRDNIYVKAEIPGLRPTEPEILLEGDTLTIKGEHQPQVAPGEKVSYHRREIEYGRFSRAVTLPTKINTDRVTAKAKNGILTITLPKAEEAKPRQVAVNVD